MEFKTKNQEELSKLSVEELAGYYNALNAYKNAEIQKLIEQKASKNDIDALKLEISTSIKEQVKNLNEILVKQGLAIEKIGRNEKVDKKTIKQALLEQLEDLKNLKDRETAKNFSLKTVGDMSITGSVTGEIPQSMRETGLNVIATREPFIQQLVQIGATNSNLITWVEQANKEGGAGGTAETVAKNQADFELVLGSESVKKRTVLIRVSEEMLEDIDFIESEINNELLRLLNLDIDNQILNGNSLNSNLNGIITQATAYSAGAFAGTIVNANIFDVLITAINQVITANFMPTVVVLNPTDVAKMKLSKDLDGGYLMPPFTSAEGLQIEGIRIVKNTGIAAGKFLVMDGTRCTVFFRKGITVEMGRNGNDFKENMFTILAEARLACRIKGNDVTAFVYGDIATAIAAIDKAS
jgi:HK97 family phage major capsid protein